MQRPFLEGVVRQDSKNTKLHVSDLMKQGNKAREAAGLPPKVRINEWLDNVSTKELFAEIEAETGEAPSVAKQGRNGGTWIHPIAAVDLMLWLAPSLKFKVYSWVFDGLILARNDSGDSYKLMAGGLLDIHKNKSTFAKKVVMPLAVRIKRRLCVTSWETASELQLKQRDRLHDRIEVMSQVMPTAEHAIDAGFASFEKEQQV
jgi:hypothetical protein